MNFICVYLDAVETSSEWSQLSVPAGLQMTGNSSSALSNMATLGSDHQSWGNFSNVSENTQADDEDW